MKKMMAKGGAAPDPDMHSQAKLKVLGHLRKMASDMMGQDVQKGMTPSVADPAPQAYAKGGMVKSPDYKPDPKQENDGSAESEGLDDHDEDTEPSVAELNSMDNEADAEDYNEEHTHESLDAEIARLHEMKRRISKKD